MKKEKTLKILILSQNDIAQLADGKTAIRAVEEAFREMGLGHAKMPAKVYLNLPEYSGDFRAMPAYLSVAGKCSLKWVSVYPENPRRGLPAVMALIILSDPKTGLPLCVMDGTRITALRTGAAGGVAAKYLARKDSHVVGLVGAGVQARFQLNALQALFRIRKVNVFDTRVASVEVFCKEMKRAPFTVRVCSGIKECVRGCDIVVTTTPSRQPLVKFEWLKPGVHVNAIGADNRGKEELDPRILSKAKVVVDSWEQASHSGEINVPVAKGLFRRQDVYAELGTIVARKKRGRTSPNEITVFDSTGLAIQDLALASLIYRRALYRNAGIQCRLF